MCPRGSRAVSGVSVLECLLSLWLGCFHHSLSSLRSVLQKQASFPPHWLCYLSDSCLSLDNIWQILQCSSHFQLSNGLSDRSQGHTLLLRQVRRTIPSSLWVTLRCLFPLSRAWLPRGAGRVELRSVHTMSLSPPSHSCCLSGIFHIP